VCKYWCDKATCGGEVSVRKVQNYVPFLLLIRRALIVRRHKSGVLIEGGTAKGAVENADRNQHETRANFHQLRLVGLLGIAGNRVGVRLVNDLIVTHPCRKQ